MIGYDVGATLEAHWSELTPPPPAPELSTKPAQMEARLTELSQPGPGKGRIARADITGEERREYERLGREFNDLNRKAG